MVGRQGRRLKNAMDCGRVAMLLKVSTAYAVSRSDNLSGRRPCLVRAAHALSRSDTLARSAFIL
jgi:hypothetical protein